MTKASLAHFKASKWFKSRPKEVRAVAARFPPGLYRLCSTNQVGLLYCYEQKDDGTVETCKIDITPETDPRCLLPRRVFGVKFSDLEPVDILE